MLNIVVAFDVDQQQWTHDFKISRSSTVQQLKERMLGPGAIADDIAAFELQRSGCRVHDAEQLVLEQTLSFEYLGQEEGAKRAAKDRACSPPQPFQPNVEEVEVTVRHATEPEKGQIVVRVKNTSTVGDVRRAVMQELGESKLSEVKIVKRMGDSFSSRKDDEKIESCRDFLSMGRALQDAPEPPPVAAQPPPPPPAPEPPAPAAAPEAPAAAPEAPAAAALAPGTRWTVTVVIDRALGFETPVEVSGGDTIRTVKELLAATDPTGSTTADIFNLGISPPEGSDARAVALPDSTVLTQAHLRLDATDLA